MERPYEETLTFVKGVIEGESDLIANLANVAAILKTLEGFFWVGFYLVRENELVLGPFQGPVACTRIAYNRGVCGTAWAQNKSILVPDVHKYPGHIACNPNSRSELVVPIRNRNGEVSLILDIDSDTLDAFNPKDLMAIEEVATCLSKLIP